MESHSFLCLSKPNVPLKVCQGQAACSSTGPTSSQRPRCRTSGGTRMSSTLPRTGLEPRRYTAPRNYSNALYLSCIRTR